MTESLGQKWMWEGVRLFPNSNTCSLLSCGTWKEEQYFISCFHICPKERFLFASPECEHDYEYVCMPKKKSVPKGAHHLKGLLRVIRKESSPKLEHAHNIFSLLPPQAPPPLLPPLPLSKMKTSPQTFCKHPKQSSVPSLHPHTLTLKEQHISMNDTGSGLTSEFTAKFIHL